jgi:hypothetical protein
MLRGNWSQPTATVSACFSRFRGRSICHRLPLVAPARLHKRSILSAQIRDEKTDLGALESSTARVTTFHVERGSLAGLARALGPKRLRLSAQPRRRSPTACAPPDPASKSVERQFVDGRERERAPQIEGALSGGAHRACCGRGDRRRRRAYRGERPRRRRDPWRSARLARQRVEEPCELCSWPAAEGRAWVPCSRPSRAGG